MTATPQNSWETLFAAPEGTQGEGTQVELRLLRKGGQPLLLLPRPRRAAATTMDLYPAQTSRARAARAVLRCLCRASLSFGTKRIALALRPADSFVRFLLSFAGEPAPAAPTLGILAGNPNTAGQRFLLLVFDTSQRPVAVVKAGLSERARALIEQEASFLASVPANTPAVPRLRSRFESSRLSALALDFFPGDSPRPWDQAVLPALLASWVDPKRTIQLPEAPNWLRLAEAAPAGSPFPALAQRVSGRTVHPTICHGDFAPWNIKVSPEGTWTALDWERGELVGIPGWDWFHYVIQSSILVGHLATPDLVRRIESLLDSVPFRRYAAQAGLQGCEREPLLAYLLYVVWVVKPSEGLAATGELLKALCARWGIT